MKKGGILITLIILLVAVGTFFAKKWLWDNQQTSTSDSNVKVETIRGAGDGYAGYSPIQMIEMKKAMVKKGIEVQMTDDHGNYAQRLQKFADGEYDLIVLPVNAYIQHGMKYKYPGVIVGGISESVGADVILGFPDVVKTGTINDLNNSNLKIVYTPSSPSSFLLDFTISDFDLDQLATSKSWRKEVDGSPAVYEEIKKAKKDRKNGDVFVLWEPEASKAIKEFGLKRIWGSEKFRGYIIDVFVFNRNFVDNHPEKIKDFLSTYYDVLAQYEINKEDFIKEMSDITSLNKEAVTEMITGIDWYDLNENCSQLFGMQTVVGSSPKEGMVNCILACNNVMYRMKTIPENIKDPYMIINSSFLESIKQEKFKNIPATAKKPLTNKFDFPALNENQWGMLKEVGTIRIEDITFDQGTEKLDAEGEKMIDQFASTLSNNYPQYRLIVKGHTGEGDEKANLALSQMRADRVRQRLIAVYNINPNRILAKGYGSKKPPLRKVNENPRLYKNRWARVEFVLLKSQL